MVNFPGVFAISKCSLCETCAHRLQAVGHVLCDREIWSIQYRPITLPARCLSCARVVEVLQLNAAKRITINISSYSVTEANKKIRLSAFYAWHCMCANVSVPWTQRAYVTRSNRDRVWISAMGGNDQRCHRDPLKVTVVGIGWIFARCCTVRTGLLRTD